MRDKALLAKKIIDKQELIDKIEILGKKHNFFIEKDKKYELNDIYFLKEKSEEKYYPIGFRIVKNSNSYPERYSINGNDYMEVLNIHHHSEVLSDVNVLIKELFEIYPDLYVTDEYYKDFYNLDDINSGNVTAWLKE